MVPPFSVKMPTSFRSNFIFQGFSAMKFGKSFELSNDKAPNESEVLRRKILRCIVECFINESYKIVRSQESLVSGEVTMSNLLKTGNLMINFVQPSDS